MGDLFRIKKKNSGKSTTVIIVIIVLLLLIVIGSSQEDTKIIENSGVVNEENVNLEDKNEALSKIPPYKNLPYYVVNNNNPFFNNVDLVTTSYEKYSELDSLRKMWRDNCLYRTRFNANGRKRKYRKCETNRLANCKI